MSKKVGFALLGCGSIAQKHCSAIVNHLEKAALVAVCDLSIEKARSIGERYAVPWYRDVHQMMEQMGQHIDVVNILTPSGYHCSNVLDLAPYSKHLCVEKPMALTVQDADTMIEACKGAGIHLFVVKQNRFNLPVQKLRRAIDGGQFGKLVLGSARVRWCRPEHYYNSADWRGTWALDGGVFANQASHFIDLLQWLMGDVQSVFAKGARRLANIEAEDTGIATLQFCSGALGVLEATTAIRPSNLEGSLTIMGEQGTVEIGGHSANELRLWKFTNPKPEDEKIFDFAKNLPNFKAFSHVNYLDSVIKTITKGVAPAVNGDAGRISLQLISAIYESMETGQEVNVGSSYHSSRLGALSPEDHLLDSKIVERNSILSENDSSEKTATISS